MTTSASLRLNQTSRTVLPETVAIVVVGLLDLFHTIWLIEAGHAVEANPIIAPLLEASWVAFALGKVASLIIPLAFLEHLRQVRSDLVVRALRWTLVGYLAVYAGGFLQLNLVALLGA